MLMLMRLRWSGVGCLGLVLWLPVVALATVVAPKDGSAPGVAIALGFVAAAVVVWLLGSWLNGRGPEPRHTIGWTRGQAPLEYSAAPYLIFGLVFGASVVGRATSPLLGWAVFVVGVIAVFATAGSLKGDRRRRGQIAAAADRAALARHHGWRYQADGPGDLALRWRSLAGWRVHSIAPFGVVSGKIDGVPFTMFDAEADLLGATDENPCTTWAIHLSHAYPRLVTKVRARPVEDDPAVQAPADVFGPDGRPDFAAAEELFASLRGPVARTPDEVDADTDIPGFAEALLTPAVREVSVARGLVGWRIENSDLLFTAHRQATPRPAGEIADTAHHLVTLARRFPADLATRYGAAPTWGEGQLDVTGVPAKRAWIQSKAAR